MHNPGICGVILAAGSPPGSPAQAEAPPSASKEQMLVALIDALNADSDMVLVALNAEAESLAPAIWARAAYVVSLPPGSSDAVALRTALREVLNRGRDTALVALLDAPALTADTVHRMVTTYCAAGDEIWAIVPGSGLHRGYPVLLGRHMIELLLRGENWSGVDEILAAHAAHVQTLAGDGATPAALPGMGWQTPWH
jgi:CTP:molybdopterin cytidylyltransferase MocA